MMTVKTVKVTVTWEQHAGFLQHDTKSRSKALLLVMVGMQEGSDIKKGR